MRTIKKEIGLEELVSRIPSLFPYIDFDIYGDSVLYKGSEEQEGSEEQDVAINSREAYSPVKRWGELGVLRKATYGIEGSYGHVMGSFKMPPNVELYGDPVMYYPVSYVNKEYPDDIIETFQYNDLSLYGRNCYKPKVYKYYGEITVVSKHITQTGDGDNIVYILNGNLIHNDIKYYRWTNGDMQENAIYTLSENPLIDDEVFIIDGDDLVINGHAVKTLTVVENKQRYILDTDYNEIADDLCDKYDYRPLWYYNIHPAAVNAVDVNNDKYEPINGIDNVWVSKNNGWYQELGEYYELITRESFLNKSSQSKIDFEVKECSDGENYIDLSDSDLNLSDENTVINGIKCKIMPFVVDRETNNFMVGVPDNDNAYEFYGLGVRKQLIAPGEVYSYRSMMDFYYANRNRKIRDDYRNVLLGTRQTVNSSNEIVWEDVCDEQRFVNKNDKTDIISYVEYHNLLEEKQSFITFIDDAIGKCFVEESVKEYNSSVHEEEPLAKTYTLENTDVIGYEQLHDSVFYDINKLFECIKYVKTYDCDDQDNSNAYLYVNKYNGSTITRNVFESLPEYGSSSYRPSRYNLIEGGNSDDTAINSDVYNKLSFYGKNAYTPYEYINAVILSAEEYDNAADKSLYKPYTYVNVNNSLDIISKNVYDTAYRKDMTNGEYVVYQYITSDYVVISNNDYINIYNSNNDWHVYTYVNKTKSNDVITAEDYENLDEYGSLDYTAIEFINADISTTDVIDENRYYELDFNGQHDYTKICRDDNDTSNKKRDQYEPFEYQPKEFVKNIDEFQYNALPKYGAKDYVENEYYARIDISADGEQPTYETYIITAQQYNAWNDASIVGEKYQYSIYSYKPDENKLKPGDSADDYVVLFEDYENVPYFGQVDYVEVMNDNGNGEDTDIDLHREIYIHRRTGAIISEREYGVLSDEQKDNYESTEESGKCTISLVPEVIYLAQVNGMLYQMRNMKRNHELLISKKLPLETDVNCEYSKYLRMGGEDMIKLLEWLLVKADEKADELLNYGILDNYITMPLTLNLTLQDIGYYTPAMNYKVFGDIIEPGERFTYVDEYGVAETYKNKTKEQKTLTPGNSGKPDENVFLRLRSEIENAVNPDENEMTLSGTIDSQLKTLRMPITYSNYMDQPETPKDGEDWLFYYRKGGVYDATSITDENGDIAQIVEANATGSDLYIYGNILSDIKADNTTCTIEFTYYLNAHLKLVGAGEQHTYECYVTKEEYEERYENKQSKFWVHKTDKSVKISATNPDKQNYDNLFSSEIDEYCQWDEENGEYVNCTPQPPQGQEDEYPYRHIIISYYDKVFELDKDSVYGKHHGVKHVDTYHYEQYGELYDLVENGGFENYINSTNRGIEKYAFKATPTNSMRKIVNNIEITIPYISSEFEFKFDQLENSNNDLYNNIYKEDLLNGIHYKPIISNEAFIVRGTNAAFERHLRLGEIKSLEDFENYHNGSFFNIQNNF